MQHQAGHEHASTTAIYTCVSSDFRTRTCAAALDDHPHRRDAHHRPTNPQRGGMARCDGRSATGGGCGELMAGAGMFTTVELVPLLAERGIGCPPPRSTAWSPAPRNGSPSPSSPRSATSSTSPRPT